MTKRLLPREGNRRLVQNLIAMGLAVLAAAMGWMTEDLASVLIAVPGAFAASDMVDKWRRQPHRQPDRRVDPGDVP